MNPHSLPHHSFLPTVYVHPPAEDSLPPYCCFDAAQGDQESLLDTQVPIKHSIDEVISKRTLANGDQSDNEDYGQDITIRGEELASGDLSEVVEVIKVRRVSDSKKPSTPVPTLKHSDTFISRAFRSIKNVNRTVASRGKKPRTQDTFSPSESTPSTASLPFAETTPRPRRVSRRNSVNLAQLFNQSPSSPKTTPRSSFDSTTSSISPSSPRRLRRSAAKEPRDSIDADSIRPSIRSPSPTPSTQTFAVKRRFSVLNLFSRTSSDTSPTIVKMTSMESLGPSSCSSGSSSGGPVTPVEIDAVPVFDPAVPFEHPNFSRNEPEAVPPPVPPKGTTLLKRLPSFIKKGGERKKGPDTVELQVADEPGGGDISFEMRLDSLHFDELSFDVDRF